MIRGSHSLTFMIIKYTGRRSFLEGRSIQILPCLRLILGKSDKRRSLYAYPQGHSGQRLRRHSVASLRPRWRDQQVRTLCFPGVYTTMAGLSLVRTPIWTAFITHQIHSPVWISRASAKVIHLADLYKYVFTEDYASQLAPDGQHELSFTKASGGPHILRDCSQCFADFV